MTLKDEGFRFCLRPDFKRARWIHPVEFSVLYYDWIDVTDMKSDDLVDLLMKEENKAP